MFVGVALWYDLHGAAVSRVAPDGQVMAGHTTADIHRHTQTDDERHVREIRRSGYNTSQKENKGMGSQLYRTCLIDGLSHFCDTVTCNIYPFCYRSCHPPQTLTWFVR